MTPEKITRICTHIQNFTFEDLFIDELGWDQYRDQLEVMVENDTITLNGFAQKRGMVAFLIESIPENKIRRKIERQVAKSHRENIIIYVDAEQTEQVWQWVRRETGKPLANRERKFQRGQSGQAIAQVLDNVVFSLDEEDNLTIVDVTSRVRAAFDVEKVTKKFYDRFKKQHDAFLKFIDGIPDSDFKRWYASVMLNRIMFIYFLQYKGFLDGDRNYLGNRLAKSDGNFYRNFLIPLFFEGFAKKDHSREIKQLLGDVPYLNGGLFLPHQVEEHYGDDIAIPDDAFEKLFKFFDDYHWHLDDRPLHDDTEINPDVLGYIFEKYINQKQMGAYYTKEDITEYISKNTVIPFLFDEAHKAVKIAFEGEHTIWDLLVENPDRYIYPAVQHGTQLELPDEIAVGIDDVSQREQWNTPAPPEYGLPTEIWRETVARHQRCFDIRGQLENGKISQINDLITLNLDMQQFAQDVLGYTDSPDVIRAFWKSLNRITVLDPTCGSGAFLFAALNILEPMYEACLERMEGFLSELDENAHPQKYSDFREVMARIDQHPNRTYFILKSIIIQNLYGVDIMEEAIEIAKLRLFLKLMAQVDDKRKIEPLPDIDFNIRAGNTLVGFATQDEVRRALQFDASKSIEQASIENTATRKDKLASDVQKSSGKVTQGKLLFGEDNKALEEIERKAQEIDRLFREFRKQQTELGGEASPEEKSELKRQLAELETELNHLLSRQYDVDPTNKNKYEKWIKSHKPFHWFIDFYGVIKNGGFDVIIGNPPYLENRQIDYDLLDSFVTGSPVHSVCIERSVKILKSTGATSMIVPLAIVSTQRMEVVQELIEDGRDTWYANYSWRPAKLFDQVNRALTIFVAVSSQHTQTFSSGYQKWISDTRNGIMERLNFTEIPDSYDYFFVPKFSFEIDKSVFSKLSTVETTIEKFIANQNINLIYYRTTGGLYWKVFTDFSPKFLSNGKPSTSSRETTMSFLEKSHVTAAIAILSSNLFWWWYTISSNLRDLNPTDIKDFPVPKSALNDLELIDLGQKYIQDMNSKSTMLVRMQKHKGKTETQSFKIRKSKHIIDEIDAVLAQHYGFTDEELDFIINYDIKYRMGSDLFDGDGDA